MNREIAHYEANIKSYYAEIEKINKREGFYADESVSVKIELLLQANQRNIAARQQLIARCLEEKKSIILRQEEAKLHNIPSKHCFGCSNDLLNSFYSGEHT